MVLGLILFSLLGAMGYFSLCTLLLELLLAGINDFISSDMCLATGNGISIGVNFLSH